MIAEQEALQANVASVLAELDAMKAGSSDDLVMRAESAAADVIAKASIMQRGLDVAAVEADEALAAALAVVEVSTASGLWSTGLKATVGIARPPHPDPSLQATATVDAITAPALLEQEALARAAVAAIPLRPITKGHISLLPPRDAIAGPIGDICATPPVVPHEHTPHCAPECALVYDAGLCNHAPSVRSAVFEAAAAGDASALKAALSLGGSTEEAVSHAWPCLRHPCLSFTRALAPAMFADSERPHGPRLCD